MIAASNPQEEAKLAAMQRAFQPNRRLASTLSLFDEETDLEGFLSNTNTVQVIQFKYLLYLMYERINSIDKFAIFTF